MSNWLANSLWELMGVRGKRRAPGSGGGGAQRRSRAKPQAAVVEIKPTQNSGVNRLSMQQKYDAIVIEMKKSHGVHVRKWRKGSSGLAWEIRYRDGRVKKFIEAPYPRGPMSAAIFLHEIGHHAIGLGRYRPRCLEEHHVWIWALATMREKGLNVTPAVEKRVERSMRYAVGKARRRGIRSIPPELVRFT